MLKIALVGRPNVGKSTLLNCLARKKIAITDDFSGLTRDLREEIITILGFQIQLTDMAGWEQKPDASDDIAVKMNLKIKQALMQADVIFFILDGKAGLLPADSALGKELFKLGKPIYALINKMESGKDQKNFSEFSKLGLEDLFAISAAHNQGIDALREKITQLAEAKNSAQPAHANPAQTQPETHASPIEPAPPEYTEPFEDTISPLNFVILGRPNVGKSTLVNRLLGEEKMIVSDVAGTTRDAIVHDWHVGDKMIHLYDTAGLRRKSRIHERVEKLSVSDSLQAVRFAHVVALMLDATCPLEKQELRLIRHVADEGRAVMILVNKWDLVKNQNAVRKQLLEKIEITLPMIREVPVITLSAREDDNFSVIFETAQDLYALWCKRVATPVLNRWLEQMLIAHSPPLIRGRRLKIRYMTQVKARPPQFHLFASAEVPVHYQRYLIGALRRDFDWHSVPLRLIIRKNKNPYQDQKPRRKTKLSTRTKAPTREK